jgi:hypothetical protein
MILKMESFGQASLLERHQALTAWHLGTIYDKTKRTVLVKPLQMRDIVRRFQNFIQFFFAIFSLFPNTFDLATTGSLPTEAQSTVSIFGAAKL